MFRKIISTFATRVGIAGINLAIAVVISQFLGAAGKGEQSILITTIALILIVSNLVGGPSLVYLTPRYPLRYLLIPSYSWTLITAGGTALVLYVSGAETHSLIWHVIPLSVLNSAASINLSVLLGREKIRANNLVNLIQVALTLSVLILLFATDRMVSINAYIAALYAGFGAGLLLSMIFMAGKNEHKAETGRPFLTGVLSGIFRYGLYNQIGTVAQMLSFRVSYYFIEFFSGSSAVGLYSNAVSVIESVWLVSTSITMVQYSKIVNSGDEKYSASLTLTLTKAGFAVALLIIVPVLLLPAGFYEFVFGQEFGPVTGIMKFLAPGVLIFTITLIVGHFFSGTGRYHLNMISMICGLIVTLALAPPLVAAWGNTGAAVAATASYTITTAITLLMFIRVTGLPLKQFLISRQDIQLFRNSLRQFNLRRNE